MLAGSARFEPEVAGDAGGGGGLAEGRRANDGVDEPGERVVVERLADDGAGQPGGDEHERDLVAGPRPGNFYQLSVSGLKSPDEISAVVARMQAESKIVEFVAARE